ncbi:MAG: ATPase, T2SS/T4P/T4SS family [Anderseniella sp.]|jgi:general secretion pathway protein E|nr:ATPase, T2SS/T4P/T4SS family [Anderseniella sp.]
MKLALALEADRLRSFPIGEMLVKRGLISNLDLDKALALQKQMPGRLGAILVRLGALSEDALLPVLSEQTGFPVATNADLPMHAADVVETVQMSGLSAEWCLDQSLLMWEAPDGVIHCACRDPLQGYLHETLAAVFPARQLRWLFIRSSDLDRLLKTLEQTDRTDASDISHLRELAEEAPVVELVNNTLAQAIDERASDVHVEPEESVFHIRFRVDGILHTRASYARESYDAVASRIKLVSGMDIAERRLPQDGRISMRASGEEIDIRISAVPGVHGESIVMRLLPKERKDLALERLGLEPDHLELLERWIREPHGIILVTGPTGSGKSTTLYAALTAMNDRSQKIITVEDPVEYQVPGITQIQAHAEIGYTFARALRAILRQDPDVVMVGEIRDLETAEIAVQASLTGHLVLSTLHTNDALSAFARLVDLGVEPFLVASSVRLVQAQRLVRRLCLHCAEPMTPSPAVLELMRPLESLLATYGPADWRSPLGCPQCRGTGYQGRIGIYEFVVATPEFQQGISQGLSASDLVAISRRAGYRSLREDGLIKAWRGLTSVDEVLRVTGLGSGG